ncbi:uncharacterized protein G2W53_010632 [Senna tora]|uniref:Uncharacterized protein n=1 Tax=Senna tora TaxID=362788 RepID=A0A834X096_9FABA|nr:uncharacterized protein G2W53_010632 [Senna tora]
MPSTITINLEYRYKDNQNKTISNKVQIVDVRQWPSKECKFHRTRRKCPRFAVLLDLAILNGNNNRTFQMLKHEVDNLFDKDTP